jgi:hypothetical protein
VATFLHKPARDGDAVAELKAAKAPEDQHLDFKGGFWEDSIRLCKSCKHPTRVEGSAALEAAKDIAAMANAEGGDVIVGVDDTGDWASGWWGGKPFPKDADETLRRWLRNYLAPREAADPVEIRLLTARDRIDGTDHRVLAINIPPWPYGPIGVQTDIDPQKAQYSFPTRRDRDTIYRSAEEIMRLNDGSRRSIFLRFRDLLGSSGEGGAQFHLRSSMHAVAGGDIEPRPPGSCDGRIVTVTPDVVVLSLVVAGWRDPDQPALIAVALAGPIVWDGRKWVVSAR